MDSNLFNGLIDGLFPKGSRLCAAVDASAAPFLVVPGRGGPRWVLPANPVHGWPGLRGWRPYDAASRVKWGVLMGTYRAGLLGLVPGVEKIAIAVPAAADWAHLGWPGARPPKPVIYIGTPSRAQRAVAMLVDTMQKRALAVAKIPIGADARRRILGEADVLERLAKERPGLAPRLLFHDAGRGIATEEALIAARTGRKWTPAHLEFLARLRIPGKTLSLREAVAGLRPKLASLPQTKAQRIGSIMDGLDDPAPLPACWVHGDFAPWNLLLQGDRLVACDWEYAKPFGLPLFDATHFMWMQRYLFSDRKSDVPMKDSLDAFSLDAEYGDRISKFYRCAIICSEDFPGEAYAEFLYDSFSNE